MGFDAVVQPKSDLISSTNFAKPNDLISFTDDFVVRSTDALIPSPQTPDSPSHTEKSKVVIGVAGMHCKSCVRKIEDNIKVVDGIHSIKVSLAESSAEIYFDDRKLTHENLAKRISALKFITTLPNGKVYTPPSASNDAKPNIDTQSDAAETSFDQVAILPLTKSSQSLSSSVAPNSSKGKTKQNFRKHGAKKSKSKTEYISIAMDDDVERCFITITGMTCASCVGNIEKNIGKCLPILTH